MEVLEVLLRETHDDRARQAAGIKFDSGWAVAAGYGATVLGRKVIHVISERVRHV